MTSPLLINEPPLQVLPTLAERIGLHEAIVLQQIHYWITNPKIGKEHEGKRWVRNSLDEWREGNFKFWCVSTIQHILKSLLKAGYLLKTKILNGNKYDHTLWYSIDYDALNKRIEPSKTVQIDPVTFTKTPVTPSEPTNTITSDSVKVTTSDSVKVTESYSESLSETPNTIQDERVLSSADVPPAVTISKPESPPVLEGKKSEDPPSSAPPPKVQPHIAIIDAWHNAIPADVRPVGEPNYSRNVRVAKALVKAGISPEKVRAFVSLTYAKYRAWAREKGMPAVMTLEHVKTYFNDWWAKQTESEVKHGGDKSKRTGPNGEESYVF